MWSVTVKEGHRLKVLDKRLLRKILGPKREEVEAGRRKFLTL
jgi:hypothetical protein